MWPAAQTIVIIEWVSHAESILIVSAPSLSSQNAKLSSQNEYWHWSCWQSWRKKDVWEWAISTRDHRKVLTVIVLDGWFIPDNLTPHKTMNPMYSHNTQTARNSPPSIFQYFLNRKHNFMKPEDYHHRKSRRQANWQSFIKSHPRGAPFRSRKLSMLIESNMRSDTRTSVVRRRPRPTRRTSEWHGGVLRWALYLRLSACLGSNCRARVRHSRCRSSHSKAHNSAYRRSESIEAPQGF